MERQEKSDTTGQEAKGRIPEVALTCSLIEVELLRAKLYEQTRMVNTQIEHFHQLIGRLEAIAQSWEWTVRRVANLSAFDEQLQRLTAKILQEEAEKKKDPWEAVQ